MSAANSSPTTQKGEPTGSPFCVVFGYSRSTRPLLQVVQFAVGAVVSTAKIHKMQKTPIEPNARSV